MPAGKTVNLFGKRVGRSGGCDVAVTHKTYQVPVNNQPEGRLKGNGSGLCVCTCAGFQGLQVLLESFTLPLCKKD